LEKVEAEPFKQTWGQRSY